MVEFVDDRGRRRFADWFDDLDPKAATKVTIAIVRLEQGNLAGTKSVGGGVLEHRIDFGPGYRVYFGRDGGTLIILLGGGTKRRQQSDIEAVKDDWAAYKRRTKEKPEWR